MHRNEHLDDGLLHALPVPVGAGFERGAYSLVTDFWKSSGRNDEREPNRNLDELRQRDA